MKSEELLQLQDLVDQGFIDRYLDCDPATVALRTSNRALADCVKYLQRAKSKLPSWYSARCVIDGRLFEQCSSELTARCKFADYPDGELAIDLTCGFGVDTAALCAKFQRVISIEIDPIKADIAIYNFKRLAIDNVEVVCSSAEDFTQNAVDEKIKADLIFIDPSRVDSAGKKVYSLEQSSPNVLKLLPLLRKITDCVVVKLSPMFDVDECFRLFEDVSHIDVVSVSGECKEVNVHIGGLSDPMLRTINHILIDSQSVRSYSISKAHSADKILNDNISTVAATSVRAAADDERFSKNYLYVPDVAFYKSRCVEEYMGQIVGIKDFVFANYIFTSRPIDDFAGVGYAIEEQLPYNPRKIKQLLAQRNIGSATIHQRNFQIPQAELYKTLKIKEGMHAHLFFTTIENIPTCFLVTMLNIRKI